MRLGDVFMVIQGQILLMKPIPTLSQCYDVLLQDENQRDVQVVTGMNTSNVAMNVCSSLTGRFSAKGVSSAPNSGGVMKNNSDSSVICEFCHMQGHIKDKCFCVVGYPSWHHLFGKPKPKPRLTGLQRSIVAQVVMTSNDCNVSTFSIKMFQDLLLMVYLKVNLIILFKCYKVS